MKEKHMNKKGADIRIIISSIHNVCGSQENPVIETNLHRLIKFIVLEKSSNS